MTINSLLFILALLLTPFVLRVNKPYKKLIFLILNIIIFILSTGSLQSLIVSFLFIMIPYIYCHYFKKKWPLFIVLSLSFIYFNQYGWIFNTLRIPMLLSIQVFGLSYIVFRITDFVINYDYIDQKKRTLVNYLNYLLSFYTIICGPIMQFEEFCDSFQIGRAHV